MVEVLKGSDSCWMVTVNHHLYYSNTIISELPNLIFISALHKNVNIRSFHAWKRGGLSISRAGFWKDL